jgi:hypothetical protein
MSTGSTSDMTTTTTKSKRSKKRPM